MSDATFDAFVREQSSRLFRVAWLLTGDAHKGEDLLQAALLSAWLNWDGVPQREPARYAYVRKVVVNEHLTRNRRRWRNEQPTDVVPDSGAHDGRIAEAGGRLDTELLLRQLPARQRAVVVLRHLEDLSEAETASMLGCSIGTVKSQNAKALAKLETLLDLTPGV